jgi:hypothetical protein
MASSLSLQIATLIQDYRYRDGLNLTPESVERWLAQFDPGAVHSLASGVARLFERFYFSELRVRLSLRKLLGSKPKGFAQDAAEFWGRVRLVDVQKVGSSQREMLRLLGEEATAKFGSSFRFGGPDSQAHLYMDDFVFSGARLKDDLNQWAATFMRGRVKTLYVYHLARHTYGEYSVCKSWLPKSPWASTIQVHFNKAQQVENRKTYAQSSEVLWPSVTCGSLGFPSFDSPDVVLRSPASRPSKLWGAPGEREVIEREILTAGCKILNGCQTNQKPLGFSPFSPGFGSFCASFLNCPNNAPVALWWSLATGTVKKPWFPLMLRRVNE